MDINKRFNEKWQEFEKIIIEKANSPDATYFKGAFNYLSKTNTYIKNNSQQIEDLGALRNVFSHRNRANYIANIEERAVKEIETLIKSIKNPPTVKDYFGCEVFTASTTDLIEDVMDIMTKNTYTHVPIYDNKIFVGVFSYTSFFGWLQNEKNKGNHEPKFIKKTMQDISKQFLNSPVVNFQFIYQETDSYEIPLIFEEKARKKPCPERLDCILITENGKKDTKIVGIITSWDLGKVI